MFALQLAVLAAAMAASLLAARAIYLVVERTATRWSRSIASRH